MKNSIVTLNGLKEKFKAIIEETEKLENEGKNIEREIKEEIRDKDRTAQGDSTIRAMREILKSRVEELRTASRLHPEIVNMINTYNSAVTVLQPILELYYQNNSNKPNPLIIEKPKFESLQAATLLLPSLFLPYIRRIRDESKQAIGIIESLISSLPPESRDKLNSIRQQIEKHPETKKFIILNHSDHFYQKLEDEINLCYTYGAYTAVLILSRKLIENLLIDVLRNKYGNKTKSAREVYYREDKHRFHDFTRLLENLEGKKDDFKVDKDTFEKFISSVEPFRKGANSKTHSIVNLIEKKEELEKFNVQDLASLLMRLENFNKK